MIHIFQINLISIKKNHQIKWLIDNFHQFVINGRAVQHEFDISIF